MEIGYNSQIANALNPKVRRTKFGLGALLLMVGLGAIFAVAAWFIIHNMKIDSSWTREDGKVISVSPVVGSGSNGASTTYAPVVQYEVNGQSYQVTSKGSSSFMPTIGSAKQIAYNPASPAEAKVVESSATNIFVYAFGIIGLALVVLGPILFVKSLRRGHDIKDLTTTGQKLQGVLVDIQQNGSGTQSGGGTYKLVVAASTASGVQNFTSDSLTGIGGLAMADFRNNPIPIDVYLNPSNPSDYYVDVSDVPNLTPERILQLIQSARTSQSITRPAGQPAPTSAAVVPGEQAPQSPEQTQPPTGL